MAQHQLPTFSGYESCNISMAPAVHMHVRMQCHTNAQAAGPALAEIDDQLQLLGLVQALARKESRVP